ncbi:unnamed protein product [Clonostachys byssicola]|uniref:HNH nuclease domain-containing protein n=1 Tax=Clonostachys byssicola TaxID=160290 RepID=A0A9N9Y1P0_9HYPO|nr:unnamed protein product [Clonostachys byssicola]
MSISGRYRKAKGLFLETLTGDLHHTNIPLGKLGEIAQRDTDNIRIHIKHIRTFLAHFFQRQQPQEGISEPAGSSIGAQSSVSKSTQKKRHHRGTGESKPKRICSETAIPEVKLPESPAARFQKRASSVDPEQKAPILPASPPAKIPLTPSATKKQKKSQPARNSAKEHDKNRCIITGSANPQGCHIILFTWNSTDELLAIARELTPTNTELFSPDDPDMVVLLCTEVGFSDEDWNILNLSAQFHIWWGKGYFDLKFIGYEPVQEELEGLVGDGLFAISCKAVAGSSF